MKKFLFTALLTILALSFTGCYTHLMLRRNVRIIESNNYIVVEEPFDDVVQNYEDNDSYWDYDSFWDWGFYYNPIWSHYYWYPSSFGLFTWPVFYSYYYPYYYSPYYYSGIYWSYYYPGTFSYYYSGYSNKRRHFNRREPFGRASENRSYNINSVSRRTRDTQSVLTLNKTLKSYNNNMSYRIRKPVTKTRSTFFNKLRETYHRVSKYNSYTRNSAIRTTNSLRTLAGTSSSTGSSGSSSRSRSSSHSSGSHRTHK